MRSTWKRVLATVLTIVMVAGLLVVPASAAKAVVDGKNVYTLEFGTDVTAVVGASGAFASAVDGYFSVFINAYATTGNGVGTEIEGYTPLATAKFNAAKTTEGAKSDKNQIDFTAKADNPTVTVWWYGPANSKLVIGKADGNTLNDQLNGEQVTTAGAFKSTVDLTASAGDKIVIGGWKPDSGNSGNPFIYKVEVIDGEAKEATAVEIADKSTTTLAVDGELQLSATVTPSDSTDEPKWTTSDEEVATVDQTGKVTGVADGPVTITVTAGSVSDSIALTVGTGTKHTHGTTWTEDASTRQEPTCAKPGLVIEKCDTDRENCPGREKVLAATKQHSYDTDTGLCEVCKAVDPDWPDVKICIWPSANGAGKSGTDLSGAAQAFFTNSSGSNPKDRSATGAQTYCDKDLTITVYLDNGGKLEMTAPRAGTLLLYMGGATDKVTVTPAGGEASTPAAVDHVLTCDVAAGKIEITKANSSVDVYLAAFLPAKESEKASVAEAAVETLKKATGVTVDAEGKINFTVNASDKPSEAENPSAELIMTTLQTMLGEDASKVDVNVTYISEVATYALVKTSEIEYTAEIVNKNDETDKVTISGKVDVMGEEGGETEKTPIATGTYNFKGTKNQSSEPAGYTNANPSLTWDTLAYAANAEDHGPYSASGGSLTVKTDPDRFATVTVTTCGYGAGAPATTADSSIGDAATAESGNYGKALTAYNVTGEVTFTFTGGVYVHELKVEYADAAATLYNVAAGTSANGAVTVAPTGKVPAGTEIAVTATADDGYEFTGWNADSMPNVTVSNGKFAMPTNDVTVTAIFTKKTTPELKLDKDFVEVAKGDKATVTATVENKPEDATVTWGYAKTPAGSDVVDINIVVGTVNITGQVAGELTVTVKATVAGTEYTKDFDVVVWDPNNTTSWNFKSAAFGAAMDGKATSEVTWRGLTIGTANKAYTASHGFCGYGANTIAVPVKAGLNTITVTASYASGTVGLDTDVKTISATGNYEFEYTATADGTVTLNTGASTYISDISVVTTEIVKTDLSTKTVSLSKTAPVVGDVLTATVSDSIPAADVDFIWTVGGTEVTANKTATYTVAAADMGKAIKVKAQAKSGSTTYENATAEVETSAVVGKTMTVTLTGVNRKFNGQTAAINPTAKEGDAALEGVSFEYKVGDSGSYSATKPTIKNVADSATVYVKATKAGYEDAETSAAFTITKADAPTLTITPSRSQIASTGGQVHFTISGVPEFSSVAPTAACSEKPTNTISFTKDASGDYVGDNTIDNKDDGAEHTHTVTVTWSDPNYQDIAETKCSIKQLAAGAVVPEHAEELTVWDGVNYANMGVTATVNTTTNKLTIAIDEAKILAAYAADPDTFKGGNMNNNGGAYMMVHFKAPADFDVNTWKVQQSVNDTLNANKWSLAGGDTNNELNWLAASSHIGDWFGVLMGVDGATQTMPATGNYVMEYRFFNDSDTYVAATTYNVERKVIKAATVSLTANADLADVTVPEKISPEEAFELTVAVKDAATKVLPDAITVTVGGHEMADSDYTWDKTTGKVSIAADKISPEDAIVITVTPEAKLYEITVNAEANGTASASVAKATAGTEVTLTITPDSGYVVDSILAVDADSHTVTIGDGGKFTMPASNVTISVSFKAAGGETVEADKTALNAAVTAAETAIAAIAVDTDAANVPEGTKWILAADKAAYQTAIDTAKAMAAKADATQAEVDAAVTALATATTAFEAAQQDGTKTVTKEDLQAAVTAANKAAQAITVDTEAANVKRGTKWVTEEEKAAYETAIAAAQAVLDDETATDFKSALAALNEATQAFEAAQKDGEKRTSTGASSSGGAGTDQDTAGKKSETLSDGTKRTTETAKDGTVTVTDTKPDGTKAVTTTTPAGEITTTVTLGRGAETTTVSVPVDNAEPGMVAIVVNPDGTEEIIRDSVVEDGSVIFDLDENATVKIVNNAKHFVDIGGHWAERDVDYVSARELFNGVDATHFAPDVAMTRGMMAAVLFRLAGATEVEKAADFTDVKSDDWFAKAVDWAGEAGVITGYTDGSFAPGKSITRQELVVMVYRYAGAPAVGDKDLNGFTDADEVADWAAAAMTWAIQNGIIQGRSDKTLDPTGDATRAEVSAVLQRYVRLAK